MNHKGTASLETDRLILRKFEERDIEFAFKNWMSDEKVTEFLTWKAHKNIDESKDVINSWINKYVEKNFYQWAIEFKEIGEVIGTITVGSLDERIDKVHMGYCIGRNFWNMGIVTEAFREVIRFFFEEVGVNRIESQFDTNNPASGRVMEKCGLKFEGRLLENDFNNRGIVDANVYGLIKIDYEKEKL